MLIPVLALLYKIKIKVSLGKIAQKSSFYIFDIVFLATRD